MVGEVLIELLRGLGDLLFPGPRGPRGQAALAWLFGVVACLGIPALSLLLTGGPSPNRRAWASTSILFLFILSIAGLAWATEVAIRYPEARRGAVAAIVANAISLGLPFALNGRVLSLS